MSSDSGAENGGRVVAEMNYLERLAGVSVSLINNFVTTAHAHVS